MTLEPVCLKLAPKRILLDVCLMSRTRRTADRAFNG